MCTVDPLQSVLLGTTRPTPSYSQIGLHLALATAAGLSTSPTDRHSADFKQQQQQSAENNGYYITQCLSLLKLAS